MTGTSALAFGVATKGRPRTTRQRHSRLALGTGALVVISVVGVAAVGGGLRSGPPAGEHVVTAQVTSAALGNQQAGAQPSGALGGGGAASCVEDYSPGAVAGRAFAFDGTVTAIDAGRTDRTGKGELDFVAATFTVTEWFAGGSDGTAIVDLPPPGELDTLYEVPPAYQIGSRLLVSGEPRWGGAPLADAIAWGCGFTRYYDKSTADSWRAA